VLEDVAQAFGAKWGDKKVGSFGTVSAFSFFPSKNLGGYGDGGAVCTDDPEIADIVRMLTKHGGKDKYNVEHIGYNARLDTIQAAVLLAKFKYLDEFNMRRRVIAKKYTSALKNFKYIIPPVAMPDAYHVYHQYTIKVINGKREDLIKRLNDAGIANAIYYPVALHKMDLFMNKCIAIDELSNAEKLVNEVLSLPIEPLMTDEEIKKVISALKG
jgi:dTDP-4-amino-4,6-dideoxygalactose transaminase